MESKGATLFNNIAVLVDADNANHADKMELIINKILTFGRITVRRVYGNWKKDTLKNWEPVIKNMAFNAQQQFDYVKKKNATDIALVIDAMKLLYTERYDAFVIVTSDSDYTPLNITLRETGVYVIGIGKENASEAFKRSCDSFFSIDQITNNTLTSKPAEADDSRGEETKDNYVAMSNEEKELHGWLKMGAEDERLQDEDGFVNVSSIGSYIKRVRPDFDIMRFGFEKLPQFIEAHGDIYETKTYKGKGRAIIRAYKCK